MCAPLLPDPLPKPAQPQTVPAAQLRTRGAPATASHCWALTPADAHCLPRACAGAGGAAQRGGGCDHHHLRAGVSRRRARAPHLLRRRQGAAAHLAHSLAQLLAGLRLAARVRMRSQHRRTACSVPSVTRGALTRAPPPPRRPPPPQPNNFVLRRLYPSIAHLLDPRKPKGQLEVVAVDFGCCQVRPGGRRIVLMRLHACLPCMPAGSPKRVAAEVPACWLPVGGRADMRLTSRLHFQPRGCGQRQTNANRRSGSRASPTTST